MKRTVLLLLLGLSAGVGAHFSYLHWRQPQVVAPVGGELAWMREELHLTPAQYERIVALHDQDRPRVRTLANRIAAMQKQMDAFEAERRDRGEVDFVAFAQFVETFRQVNRESEQSTQKLVQDTAAMLNPRQRTRYLDLVEPWVVRSREEPERVVR